MVVDSTSWSTTRGSWHSRSDRRQRRASRGSLAPTTWVYVVTVLNFVALFRETTNASHHHPPRIILCGLFNASYPTKQTGHFHLTSLLLPSLLKSPDGRVVTVSSAAHLFADKVDWADLNAAKPGAYGPWVAYGLSKLGNILFTKELQNRVNRKGGATFYYCHHLVPKVKCTFSCKCCPNRFGGVTIIRLSRISPIFADQPLPSKWCYVMIFVPPLTALWQQTRC